MPTPRTTTWMPAAATICIAWGSRFPNLQGIETALGVILWVIFAVGHLPVALLRLAFKSVDSRIRSQWANDRRLLRKAAAMVALSSLLMYCPLPTYLTFWIVRSRIDTLAARAMADPYPYANMLQVGTVSVWPFTCDVHRNLHGVQVTFPVWPDSLVPLPRNACFVFRTDLGDGGNHAKPGWPLGGGWYMGQSQD